MADTTTEFEAVGGNMAWLVSALITKVGSLPDADLADLVELAEALDKAEHAESRASIYRAIGEILKQEPVTLRPMPM